MIVSPLHERTPFDLGPYRSNDSAGISIGDELGMNQR